MTRWLASALLSRPAAGPPVERGLSPFRPGPPPLLFRPLLFRPLFHGVVASSLQPRRLAAPAGCALRYVGRDLHHRSFAVDAQRRELLWQEMDRCLALAERIETTCPLPEPVGGDPL
jgi:hypothetical protein